MQHARHILTIGGSDPSGHAGIQADIQTLCHLGSTPFAIPTVLTSQDSQHITHVHSIPLQSIETSLQTLFADIHIHAIKTGMLQDETIINTLHQHIPHNIPLIIDPILYSSSGKILLSESAINTLENTLFPRAHLITPNIPEMETLLHEKYTSHHSFITATQQYLTAHNISAILLKGGHANTNDATDTLITTNDTQQITHPRIANLTFRGTGCCLSTCIAHFIAQDFPLNEVISKANHAVFSAISSAYTVGKNPQFKHLNFNALRETE